MALSLDQANEVLVPAAVFVGGIGVYALFIFEFYRFLARRDIFNVDFSRGSHTKTRWFRQVIKSVSYAAKYLFLFPIVACVWFAVFTVLLAFLAKNQSIDSVLLVSIAIVGAVRISAYYNEDLSRDVAKILPFALLGIFLIDISYFSISGSLDSLRQVATQWDITVYYLILVIALEYALRAAYALKSLVSRHGQNPDTLAHQSP